MWRSVKVKKRMVLATIADRTITGSLAPAALFALLGFVAGYLIAREHGRARRLYLKWAGLTLLLLAGLSAIAVLCLASATGESAGTEADATIMRAMVEQIPRFTFFVLAVFAPLFCVLGFVLRIGLDLRWRGRCPNCGYDLRGQASRRCPECGTTNESIRNRRAR